LGQLIGRALAYYLNACKSGAFLLILISFAAMTAAQVHAVATYPVKIFTQSVLVQIVFLATTPFILGLIFGSSYVRRKIEVITPKMPKAAFWLRMLVPADFKEKNFPEVRVRVDMGGYVVRFVGFVVNEWGEGDERWCRVAIPTFPLPVTGILIEVPKRQLAFSGRKFQDMAMIYISFGMKS